MEKLDPKISEWLRNHLIPRLASVFHEQFSENVECKVTKPRGSFFLSDLFFASIRFPGSCERKLLVKLPCQDPVQSASRDHEKLFDNEILFYETLAMKTNKGEFPEYYLGGKDTDLGRYIVLEDVRARGYFVSVAKTSIPLEYTLASLKSIARFHGNTYVLKEQSPKIYSDIKKRILKTRYTNKLNEPYRVTLNERIPRVTQALRDRKYDPTFTEKISSLFEDCLPNIMMELVKPIEPLATIIHGDCTINNILYRIKDDGLSQYNLEALLIDFATLMYSSPAIDVSNFIYLSCSREDIKYRTEDLIKVYHDTLVEYLKDQKVWNQDRYSYDAFWKDYKRCAIFGYLIAVYFLPMMVEYEKNNNVLDMGQDVVDKCNNQGGGEILTNILVDMLIDMREVGMLDFDMNLNR